MWTVLLPLALADPTAGEDFHVPVFVDVQPDFWTVQLLGEDPLALSDADDTLSLLDATLGRCPRVSTVVVRAWPQVPWERVSVVLAGAQATKRTVALQGVPEGTWTPGGPAVTTTERLKRVSDRGLVSLDSNGVSVDGEQVCWDEPGETLCGGDLRYLRARVGGRDVALLPSADAPAGLVVFLHQALADHAPSFAAVMSEKERTVNIPTLWLPESTVWVAQPCDKPMDGPR
jgi:hypothetical protein